MTDLAIDRAIAAVRGAIDDWGDYEPNDPRLGPDRLAFLDGLRAVLAILEAARAWAEQLQPWMGCSIPYDSQSETAKLYRAIMGKP